MDEKGAKYTVVELDLDEDGKAIRAEMADIVGRTSVPAIWIGGQFVGGCNDVSVHVQNQYVRNDCCLFLPFLNTIVNCGTSPERLGSHGWIE